MQDGAGVGSEKSHARIPSLQGVLLAPTSSRFLTDFDQLPANISPRFRPFLTGSAPQTEFDVTYSKQTTAPFLTGSRTAIKRSAFRSVFPGFSTEHFSAHRRNSLQGSIADVSPVAGKPRMQAPAGRL